MRDFVNSSARSDIDSDMTKIAARKLTLEGLAGHLKIPIDKLRTVIKIVQQPIPPETPIGEEKSSHLEQMASLLKTLTPREERIIKKRFGLEDGFEQSLEEVGNSFGVHPQRIRQIEKKALQNLLRAFLEGLIART
jgi:RNA polymerase primary sigma factor